MLNWNGCSAWRIVVRCIQAQNLFLLLPKSFTTGFICALLLRVTEAPAHVLGCWCMNQCCYAPFEFWNSQVSETFLFSAVAAPCPASLVAQPCFIQQIRVIELLVLWVLFSWHQHQSAERGLPREAVGALSLAVPKSSLDGVLSNLV